MRGGVSKEGLAGAVAQAVEEKARRIRPADRGGTLVPDGAEWRGPDDCLCTLSDSAPGLLDTV